jgi:hypothetical protein
MHVGRDFRLLENARANDSPLLFVGVKGSIAQCCAVFSITSSQVAELPTRKALARVYWGRSWPEGVNCLLCYHGSVAMRPYPLGLLGLVGLAACLGVRVMRQP